MKLTAARRHNDHGLTIKAKEKTLPPHTETQKIQKQEGE